MSVSNAYKITIAHIAPEASAMQISMLRFRELVEKQSSNRFEVTIFPNGQQGGELEMLQKAQKNVVQAVLISPMITSNVSPVITALSLPYMFRSIGNVKDFMESDVSRDILNSLEKARLVGLGYQYNDFFNLFVNVKAKLSSIRKLSDINGQVFRTVESTFCADLFRSLGFSPVPIPFPKLLDAFLEGRVEGCDGILSVMESLPIHRCFKSITLSRHMLGIPIFMMSKIFFDGLPLELRNIILDSAKASFDSVFKEGIVNQQRDKSIRFFKEKRVEVIELDENELKLFIKATQEVHKKYEKVIGKKTLHSLYGICGHEY